MLCPFCPSCPFQGNRRIKRQKGQKRHCFGTFLLNVTSDLERQLETLSDEQLETLMNKILENYNH